MTAFIDFATLPPEINSARMYAGAGAGPMLAAVSTWSGLAAELRATASSYDSVVTGLTGEEWHGPTAESMAAAAARYVAWLHTSAIRAEETAEHALAAVGAYEAAYAEIVPPALISANRAQLGALVATNFLGQNTPAIAATEAQYAEMWAQDAAAMYQYAGSCAVAAQLIPFTQPRKVANATGPATQAAGTAAANHQSALSGLVSSVPKALQGLASSGGSGGPFAWLKAFWKEWGPNANIWNTLTSTGLFGPADIIAPFLSVLAAGGAHSAGLIADDIGVSGSALAGNVGSAGQLGGAVSSGLGRAVTVGKLSVPPSWTSAARLASPVAPALGATPMVAPPAAGPGMPGIPGMPLASVAGQTPGRAVPQYGFRPTFVPSLTSVD